MPEYETMEPPTWQTAILVHLAALEHAVTEIADPACDGDKYLKHQENLANSKKEILSCAEHLDNARAFMKERPNGFLKWEGGPNQVFSHGLTLVDTEHLGIFLYRVNHTNWRLDVNQDGDYSCTGSPLPEHPDDLDYVLTEMDSALEGLPNENYGEIASKATQWFSEYIDELDAKEI